MAYRTPYWETRRIDEEKRAGLARSKAEQARILAKPGKEAAKLARREAFDRWNLREKPGPAGAEIFADRGPGKLTTVVPFGQKGDPVGYERVEALRAARLGVHPRAPAGIEKTRAEAEKMRYDIESERRLRPSIESILRTRAEEQAFGLEEARREVGLREGAGIEAVMEAEKEAEAEALAEAAKPVKPGRKLRPSLKRVLWEGRPEIGAPGLGAPIKGYFDIAELLGEYLGKGYEYAFPRTK